MVAYAVEAPSAYNIQHWRFVAVTEPEAKERLKSVAYSQQKVADAPVVFIILGDLLAYEKIPQIVEQTVAAGILPAEKAEGWVNMAQSSYCNNATLVRDEAIRSGAMAAMALNDRSASQRLRQRPDDRL